MLSKVLGMNLVIGKQEFDVVGTKKEFIYSFVMF